MLTLCCMQQQVAVGIVAKQYKSRAPSQFGGRFILSSGSLVMYVVRSPRSITDCGHKKSSVNGRKVTNSGGGKTSECEYCQHFHSESLPATTVGRHVYFLCLRPADHFESDGKAFHKIAVLDERYSTHTPILVYPEHRRTRFSRSSTCETVRTSSRHT